MKQLKFKKELDLDKPEDVNWLMEWSKQAWQRIQELEAEQSNQLENRVMQKIAEEIEEWKESMKAAIEDAIDKQEQQTSELYNAGYEEGIKYAIEMLDKHVSNFIA